MYSLYTKGNIYIAPVTGWYKIDVYGAAGGYGNDRNKLIKTPGYGGYGMGKIRLNKGDHLNIYVGEQGKNAYPASSANNYGHIIGGLGGWGKPQGLKGEDDNDGQGYGGQGGTSTVTMLKNMQEIAIISATGGLGCRRISNGNGYIWIDNSYSGIIQEFHNLPYRGSASVDNVLVTESILKSGINNGHGKVSVILISH